MLTAVPGLENAYGPLIPDVQIDMFALHWACVSDEIDKHKKDAVINESLIL